MCVTVEQSDLLNMLKGPPLSILLALNLHDGYMGNKDLVSITGWGKDVVRDGLNKLVELGYAEKHKRYWGWTITEAGIDVIYGLTGRAEKSPSTAIKSLSTAIKSPSDDPIIITTQLNDLPSYLINNNNNRSSGRAEKSPSAAIKSPSQVGRAEKSPSAAIKSPSHGDDPDDGDSGRAIKSPSAAIKSPSRKNGGNGDGHARLNWEALRQYKVFSNPKTQQIAEAEDISPEYIHLMARHLRETRETDDITGLLVNCLFNRDPVPEEKHPKGCQCAQCRQRYFSGELAEFIEH